MQYEVLGVYLIDFKENIGGEISGKHYALVISKLESKDNTLLVAPITSKKKGKKYSYIIFIFHHYVKRNKYK